MPRLELLRSIDSLTSLLSRCTSRLKRASETPVQTPSTRLLTMPHLSLNVAVTHSSGACFRPNPSTCPAAQLVRCEAAADRERVLRSGAPGRGAWNSSTASAQAGAHSLGCSFPRPMLCRFPRSARELLAMRPTAGDKCTWLGRNTEAVPTACAPVRNLAI